MSEDNESDTFTEYDEEGDKIINGGTLTELEKEYLQKAKLEHRKNMVKVQKVGNKEFTGKSFIGKPEAIVFKDFDLGVVQSMTLVLTNCSKAFNSFNVLPLPQKIRVFVNKIENYFEVLYSPKGKMSPGITCEIKFKFLPQLNEDIYSEFSILTETGQIDFPIICTSKKAIVRCNEPSVGFGKVIEGDVGHAVLKVSNQGALKTKITIKNSDGTEISEANSALSSVLSQLDFEREFTIDGFSEKTLNFSFRPNQVTSLHAKLQLYCENFLHSPPIPIEITGECVKVPVSIEKPEYDFEICLLNHIYREKLVIYNAGDLPMSFKISQPQITKKYFEFSPVIGYIQKQAKIDIWVKFIANKELQMHLSNYLKESNEYEIPFKVEIKEQTLPVIFIMRFRITSNQVIITPSELNFGSIFEGLSSKIEVNFQNESDLPQQIYLSSKKANLSIENEESLFKILPKSNAKKYLRYRTKQLEGSKKSNREEGTLTCRIITGEIATNEVNIDFNCETIKPDLSILENHIDFESIQIEELSSSSTMFKNNINKDIVFEIFVPPFEVCGIKVTPVVKTLAPNQEVEINIEYHSFFKKLGPTTLRDLQKAKKNLEEEVQPKPIEATKEVKKDPKKDKKPTKAELEAMEAEQKRLEQEAKLQEEKEEAERLELERNFDLEKELDTIGGAFIDFGNAQHYKWVLPVYFKKKDYPDASAEVNFLEVTTTSTNKVLFSDQTEINFGEIPVGTRRIKEFIFKTSDPTQKEVEMNQLPIFGCFSVLNSLKMEQNSNSFRAVVEFQPTENQRFEERLVLSTDTSKISCILKGVGARPDINITPETGLIHFGGVILEEHSERILTVKNICNFDVDFNLNRIGGGVQNISSSRPFLYIPSCGKVPANGQIEIKILFKPDRINENFYEKIKVHVPEQKEEKFVFISGYCYPRQAYVKYFKELRIPTDSEVLKTIEHSLDWMTIKTENEYLGPNNKTIVLEFQKIDPKSQTNPENCYKRKLTIGSCKLLDPKAEKPTSFELIMPKDDRFQCDNLKGTVPPGTEIPITITYKPEPIDPLIAKIAVLQGVGQWKDIKVELKVSGGFMKGGVDLMSFEVILRVYMNQI